MNKYDKLIDAISDLDADLVEEHLKLKADMNTINEANKDNKETKVRRIITNEWKKRALAAACVCLAVITVFAVLPKLNSTTPPIPGGDSTSGGDKMPGTEAPEEGISPNGKISLSNPESYDDLIDMFSWKFNNSGIGDEGYWDDSNVGGGGNNDSGGSGIIVTGGNSSQEIIDNQTAGIKEADIIKCTDTHIFHTYAHYLSIYSIEGEASKRIAHLKWTQFIGNTKWGSSGVKGMFISDDGKTLTLITELYDSYGARPYGSSTTLLILDISDITNIQCIRRLNVSGSYKDARMIGDEILLFTQYYVCMKPEGSDDLYKVVPMVEESGKIKYCPIENIFISNDPYQFFRGYTVIYSVDIGGEKEDKILSLMDFEDNLYVSSENIYLSRQFVEKTDILPEYITITEIASISWSEDSLEMNGAVRVQGALNNRFSLDEYNGVLRVVTTSQKVGVVENGSAILSADLYCFDAESLETKAEILKFAPDNETVQSVRFDKDKAYICTAEGKWTISDPVFFFDLSDLDNITSTDTGTIPGLSTSLIYFGDGKLVGIGMENGFMKMEAYEEKDGKVVSIDKFTGRYSSYSRDYKKYFIDRENGYICLGVAEIDASGDQTQSKHLLVKFDGEKFEYITSVNVSSHKSERAFVVDGYLYAVSNDKIEVVKVA